MIVIKHADIYGPRHMGHKDVLICGGRVEAMEDELPEYPGAQVIDAKGMMMLPGLMDQHVHITGGGGEGSFRTRAPEIQLSALIEGGITTVVGLLGTDGITRNVENLVAKAKALKEEGISAYALTGSYGYPSITITGDVKKDIVFIDEILGVKLAISDHRASNLSQDQLIHLASDVRTAAMLSGKAGVLVLHMGDDERGLEPVFDALKTTSIPVKTFHPTHVSRTKKLLRDAFTLAKMGGYIDITCNPKRRGEMAEILEHAKQESVPYSHITFSSDGQGSWSKYDADGRLTAIGVSSVGALYQEITQLVTECGVPLETALPFATENVARSLELYPKKGVIAPSSDADLLLVQKDFTLDTVIAGGKLLMQSQSLIVHGTYE